MEINGKVYRNLEGQVGYLTEKYGDLQEQINDIKGKLTHYVIVEELPTEDIDTSAVYLVGPKGTEPDTYYEEWVYVQLEDESWTWEKLGDTASVDLSGYLEKVTDATTYSQLYAKHADGSQLMMDVSASAIANTVVKRDSGGRVRCSNPENASAIYDAVNLGFANSNYVKKDSTTTPYAKAYIKKADSTQDTVSISSTPNQGFIVQYNTGGTLRCKDPTGNGEEAVNLSYANDHYLAKSTSTTSYDRLYGTYYNGTQTMFNVTNSGTLAYSVAQRNSAGQISCADPTENSHAATKAYVDAAVGQLLYLHDIDLAITVDSTNKLFVKAYLVNGSATAITTFDRFVYKRIDIQWGGFGTSLYNSTPVAVTKLPDGFRQDDFDEPFPGFLYQYFSGGNLVSAQTTQSMTTTITDTVISW